MRMTKKHTAIKRARIAIGNTIETLESIEENNDDLIIEFYKIEARLLDLEKHEEAKSVWSWK